MPFLVARGVRAAGRTLAVAALRGQADPRLRVFADSFRWVGVARPGSWIRTLRSAGVSQAVMIGGIKKSDRYSPWRMVQYLPDWRAFRLWYVRARNDRRDGAILHALANELADEGIELLSNVDYCMEHMATEGLMTRTAMPRGVEADVEFGWRIARAAADLEIGQALAVKELGILAIEGLEGTNAMIQRAGQLCRNGGWTMIKAARPNQDMRFDIPTIGTDTLRALKEANCRCLVVEAGKAIFADKARTLALADRLGIAVVGKTAESGELGRTE